MAIAQYDKARQTTRTYPSTQRSALIAGYVWSGRCVEGESAGLQR